MTNNLFCKEKEDWKKDKTIKYGQQEFASWGRAEKEEKKRLIAQKRKKAGREDNKKKSAPKDGSGHKSVFGAGIQFLI